MDSSRRLSVEPRRMFACTLIERWMFDENDPDKRRTWPTMEVAGRLERLLRSGEPTNRLAVASILTAYQMLIGPEMTTEQAISELRALRKAQRGTGR